MIVYIFVFFLLDIVLSVLLRCTDSCYHLVSSSYSYWELRILFLYATISLAFLGACTSYQANYLILLQPRVVPKVCDTNKIFLKSRQFTWNIDCINTKFLLLNPRLFEISAICFPMLSYYLIRYNAEAEYYIVTMYIYIYTYLT